MEGCKRRETDWGGKETELAIIQISSHNDTSLCKSETQKTTPAGNDPWVLEDMLETYFVLFLCLTRILSLSLQTQQGEAEGNSSQMPVLVKISSFQR